jgi:importin-5
MYPMLDTLPSLPHAHLPKFLITLTPLTSSHPQLFAPHLQVLLSFLPALIIPSADSGPTPTVARPYPGTQSFTFPPTQNGAPPDDEELDEEAEEVRKAALEFMISLSEAKPAMVRRVDGWVSAMVRGCLGGMGELRDDELSTWLDADVRGPFSILASFDCTLSPSPASG